VLGADRHAARSGRPTQWAGVVAGAAHTGGTTRPFEGSCKGKSRTGRSAQRDSSKYKDDGKYSKGFNSEFSSVSEFGNTQLDLDTERFDGCAIDYARWLKRDLSANSMCIFGPTDRYRGSLYRGRRLMKEPPKM
jgi:hypothetical protein